jgi:hypothetical protein
VNLNVRTTPEADDHVRAINSGGASIERQRRAYSSTSWQLRLR